MVSVLLTIYVLIWCVVALAVMVVIGAAVVRELRAGRRSV